MEPEQIHAYNLEAGEYGDIEEHKALYRLVSDRMNYIFLDEVQRVRDFQKAVDALFIRKNCDVYITGANAWLLSGELATLLSGRYVEIKMLPLSFKEFVSAHGETGNPERLYQDYIHNSSFPYALELGRPRDIRQYLKTGDKYYAADPGLRYSVLGNKKADDGDILENIVYLELLRRGYEIHIGKVGAWEVDFIAMGEEGEEYYQVAYTVRDGDGSTLERELASLDAIRDHNPKYLLTMDYGPVVSHNGIKQMYVLDWLLR